MKMRLTAQLTVAAFALALTAGPSLAQSSPPLITFHFEGVIDVVDDIDNALEGQVSVGDSFNGSFTFDETKPDIRPDPNWGEYQFDNFPDEFEMSATINGLQWNTVETDPWNFSTVIYVIDRNVIYDLYSVFTREAEGPVSCNTYDMNGMRLELLAYTDFDAISGQELLTTPPDLSRFEVNRFDIYFQSGDWYCSSDYLIRGHLTDLYVDSVITIDHLIQFVLSVNLSTAISNSLERKLDAAVRALDGISENNDVVAVNAMVAFISEVEAQRGKFISMEDADAMIAMAQAVIAELEKH